MGSPGNFLDEAGRMASAARPLVENVLVYEHTDSTHAVSLRLIEQAESEEITLPPTLIIAGRQDHGLGRSGRSWASDPGGLYLSWVFSGLAPKIVAQLPMIGAAAAHEAIGRLGVRDAAIKWPNDLLVDGSKLAGILVHVRHGDTVWASIGMGFNLENAPTIRDAGAAPAVAVSSLVSSGSSLEWSETIVATVTERLVAGTLDATHHVASWRRALLHEEGDEIKIRIGDGSKIHGRFVGLTDDGHLRLDVDGDVRVIPSGDVIE